MSETVKKTGSGSGGRKNAAGVSSGVKQNKNGTAASRSASGAKKTGTAPSRPSASQAKKPASKKPAAEKPATGKPAAGRSASSAGAAAKAGKTTRPSGGRKPAGHGGTEGAPRPKSASAAPSAGKNASKQTRPGSAAQGPHTAGNGKKKNISAAERTVLQREESRERLGDKSLRNSPGAVKLEQERARRLYKKNETFFKVIYFIAMALVVICGAFLLSFSVLFHINTINVNIGEGLPYTEEEILQASGIEIGNNLLAISTEKAMENIAYELPYIGHVSVERELPSTVNIKTEKAEVLGLALNSDRQLIVLSTEGKTLEVLRGNNPAGTPIINGMNITAAEVGLKVELEKPEQFELASQVIESFRKYGIELDSITFSSGGNTVTAVYDRRLTIKLGSVYGLEEKAELASTLINEGKILPTESGTLDMTIHGRAIFRPDYVTGNSGELEFVYEDKGEPDEQYQAELAGSQDDAVME